MIFPVTHRTELQSFSASDRFIEITDRKDGRSPELAREDAEECPCGQCDGVGNNDYQDGDWESAHVLPPSLVLSLEDRGFTDRFCSIGALQTVIECRDEEAARDHVRQALAYLRRFKRPVLINNQLHDDFHASYLEAFRLGLFSEMN